MLTVTEIVFELNLLINNDRPYVNKHDLKKLIFKLELMQNEEGGNEKNSDH